MTKSKFATKLATFDITDGIHTPFGRNARLARTIFTIEPDDDDDASYDDLLYQAEHHLSGHDNRLKTALIEMGHRDTQMLDHFFLFTEPIFCHKYGTKALVVMRRDCQECDVEPLPELPEETQDLFPVSPACLT